MRNSNLNKKKETMIMQRTVKRKRLGAIFIFTLLTALIWPFNTAMARSSYVSLIPNGNRLSCDACHTSSFGFNSFGRDFSGNGRKWNLALAQKDSDRDGASNGAELQDPNGSWVNGSANPGNAALVTNPGNASSVPANPTPTLAPAPTNTSTPTPNTEPVPNTPTPVNPVNTPTQPESSPTPSLPAGDIVAGQWMGEYTSSDSSTYRWDMRLAKGLIVGELTVISNRHDDDDEEDGDDENEPSVITYHMEGNYSLTPDNNHQQISMDLRIFHEMELITGSLSGIVNVPDSTMNLTGALDDESISLTLKGHINAPTPVPQEPTATPTVTPVNGAHPTATPRVHVEPYLLKQFTLNSPDEYTNIPGGYDSAQPATVQQGPVPLSENDFSDGRGVMITARPNEIGLIQLEPVEVEDSLILIRVSVMTTEEGASVALAALDGSLDGSIAMNMSMESEDYQERYHHIVLVYDPPEDTVIPIIQLANNTQEEKTVTLYVDNLEVYAIPKQGFTPNWLLNGE